MAIDREKTSYATRVWGKVYINPPLSPELVDKLTEYMDNQGIDGEIEDSTYPGELAGDTPCGWALDPDYAYLECYVDEGEQVEQLPLWLEAIIEKILRPAGRVAEGRCLFIENNADFPESDFCILQVKDNDVEYKPVDVLRALGVEKDDE